MIFTSGIFLVFFVVVYGVYWLLLRGQRTRVAWLLLASQVFYGWWDWRFLGLMWIAILTSHFAGLAIERGRRPRAAMAGAIIVMLGILATFKYFNFFVDSMSELLRSLGLSASPHVLQIILPVGISFYTFQAISYVVDVWRRDIRAERHVVDTATYISFFPQLVAGPIVRAADFLPQLREEKRFDNVDFLVGAKLFLVGFIYKAIFSDNISPFVDEVYADIARFDNHSLAMATLGFYAQIYFDFAGYSIMAIGIARMFGYRLMRNFDYPYLSTSITEFWRRWHISLSSWLRDYLYIPLGGNRGGEAKRNRNLMVTMLLGGLWHGASWNFVAWGGLHGTALAVHKEFGKARRRWLPAGLFPPVLAVALAWLATQFFVYLTWIPFRAPDFGASWEILRGVFQARDDAGLTRAAIPYALLIAPIFVDTFVVGFAAGRRVAARLPAWSHPVAAFALGAILAVLLFMMPLEVNSFIYFQF
ncbi:MBOAT family protein [Luteimonas pelagia]